MCREYYLHKRNNIYYAEFYDIKSGVKLTTRSTGENDHIKAQVKAEVWIANGIPAVKTKKPRPLDETLDVERLIKTIRKTDINADDAMRIVTVFKNMGLIDVAAVKNTGQGAIPFIEFLQTFWDYDKSEYIQDKLAHGHRFSRGHAHECQKRLKKDIIPFFGCKKLNCVTIDDLKELTMQLAKRGLATSTINQALLICCTPLKWAFNEKIIPTNPAIGLTKFSVINKERGVLTFDEAAALFSVEWKDKRAFAASLLSATTGLRQGECLAIRKSDIGKDMLNIKHSYSMRDGLKCPKNGHKRIVPLLPEVRTALLDLLHNNPHDVDDPFVFYSLIPNKPIDRVVIYEGLIEAIKKINEISQKEAEYANKKEPNIYIDYKKRNICFHSWRHFFCSKITTVIDSERAAKISGHLSEKIFKKYADHIETKNIQEVSDAAAKVFSNIVRFKKVV